MTLSLEGAFTALATPFRNGSVDLEAMASFTEFQIAGGIGGVVPCGTTGESPTLSAGEAKEVVATVVRAARGRVPVIAGTGSNNTVDTIARTQAAQEAGADAAMVVMPYYNKPTQRGLIAHVQAVHEATSLPIVLYNVPTRGTADLAAESVVEIARTCPRVVGLKEATGNVLRAQSVVAALGERITVLCGDDALTVAMMAVGAKGVISVASNVVPGAVQDVVRAFLDGDLAGSLRKQQALLPVYEAMFLESNPGPVKAALAAMRLFAPEVRLPLAWVSEGTAERVVAALRAYGVSL
ncbi:MAG: 4-hydroxy-tetrahydrodipicolinate synthase [Polyangiales bacterium]